MHAREEVNYSNSEIDIRLMFVKSEIAIKSHTAELQCIRRAERCSKRVDVLWDLNVARLKYAGVLGGA